MFWRPTRALLTMAGAVRGGGLFAEVDWKRSEIRGVRVFRGQRMHRDLVISGPDDATFRLSDRWLRSDFDRGRRALESLVDLPKDQK